MKLLSYIRCLELQHKTVTIIDYRALCLCQNNFCTRTVWGEAGVLETHVNGSGNDTTLWYNVGYAHNVSMAFPFGRLYEENVTDKPVSVQLDNGMILTMFERGNTTWNRMGKHIDKYDVEWTTNTFTEFKGVNNDVIQLQNGRLLNVHEDPYSNAIRYVLGRWKEEEGSTHRVVWWACNM